MKRLDDGNSLELLEAIATKHDLLLSDNLIDFVSELRGLIVQECAEICLEANDHKNILRHFGVKE